MKTNAGMLEENNIRIIKCYLNYIAGWYWKFRVIFDKRILQTTFNPNPPPEGVIKITPFQVGGVRTPPFGCGCCGFAVAVGSQTTTLFDSILHHEKLAEGKTATLFVTVAVNQKIIVLKNCGMISKQKDFLSVSLTKIIPVGVCISHNCKTFLQCIQ